MCKLRIFKLTVLFVLVVVFLDSYTSLIQVLFLSLVLTLVSALILICCVIVYEIVMFVARQIKSLIGRAFDSLNIEFVGGIT